MKGILGTGQKLISMLSEGGWRGMIIVYALVVVGAILEAASVGIIYPVVLLLLDPGSNGINFGSIQINYEFSDNNNVVIIGSFAVLGLFLIKNLVLLFVYYLQNTYVMTNLIRVARELHERYMQAPYQFHLTRHSTDLTENTIRATYSAFVGGFIGFVSLASEATIIFFILSVLIFVNWQVTILAATILLIGAGGFYMFFHGLYAKWGQRTIEGNKALLRCLQDGFGAIKELKALGREAYITDLFVELFRGYTGTIRNKQVMLQAPRLWLETLMIIVFVTVVAVYVQFVSNPQALVATLSAFAMAGFRLLPAFNRCVIALNRIKDTQHAIDTIYHDLNLDELSEKSSQEPPAIQKLNDWSSISFENVSFAYEGQTSEAVSDLTFTIKRDTCIGFVGESGSGKTTVADLALGLLPVTSGKILIGSHNMEDILPGWRKRVAYVPQSPFIVDDSIRNNIALGINPEEISQQKIDKSIELAELADILATSIDREDAILGEAGARVSGGQRQRVSIARAFYGNPELIVFDEATSALDAKTENRVKSTIERVKGKSTLIIVAHRLSTVRLCDQIFFFERGRIVDIGSFDELYDRNVNFKHLVDLSYGVISPNFDEDETMEKKRD